MDTTIINHNDLAFGFIIPNADIEESPIMFKSQLKVEEIAIKSAFDFLENLYK